MEIVRFFLFLEDRDSDSDNIDSAWEEEIRARIQAVDSGMAVGIDFDKAMQTKESWKEYRKEHSEENLKV